MLDMQRDGAPEGDAPGRWATVLAPPRVGVLADARCLAQRQPRALVDALAARGVEAEVVLAGGDAGALAACDVVIGRGRSSALVVALGMLEARGVPVLNRAAAIAGVSDRAHQLATLEASGLPVVESFLVEPDAIASAASQAGYPAVVKPVSGDGGPAEARVVFSLVHAMEAARTWREPRSLVQPFVARDRPDLRLRVVAGRVWATEQVGSPGGAGASREVPLPPGAEALALRCGALFGLDVYGVDCLVTADGVFVREVTEFPEFSALPQADDAIAALLLARARPPLPAR